MSLRDFTNRRTRGYYIQVVDTVSNRLGTNTVPISIRTYELLSQKRADVKVQYHPFKAQDPSAVIRVTWHSLGLFSIVQSLQLALPKLREAKGKVILLSSAAGEHGIKGMGAYGASKAALNQLNRTLAVEEPTITTIAFHPGSARTEMAYSMQREGKGHMDPAVAAFLSSSFIEPDVPGCGIRNLALRAGTDYTGKYLYYDDPLVTSL